MWGSKYAELVISLSSLCFVMRSQNIDFWVHYRLGCSVEGCDTRFGHESKSSLLSLDSDDVYCVPKTPHEGQHVV